MSSPERVQGKSAADAVIETNYWCAEHATYQASDGRTLGPLGVLASGDGRCGEGVHLPRHGAPLHRHPGAPALRAVVGALRRQPRLGEAQVDGSWHYLGACEPEEALDRGWFYRRLGRAMAVQTRTYADFGFNFERDRARLTREGDMVIVNVTSSYAPVITLTVEVADATGAPAAGVDVDLSIMNAGGWRDIARLVTDEDGRAAIEVGAGSLRVYARTATGEADTIIDTAAVHEVHLQLAAYDAAFPPTPPGARLTSTPRRTIRPPRCRSRPSSRRRGACARPRPTVCAWSGSKALPPQRTRQPNAWRHAMRRRAAPSSCRTAAPLRASSRSRLQRPRT